MEKFTRLTGVAAALERRNVDTDVIIRIERLFGPSREEMGRWAFEALRYLEDGGENPDFVLNRPAFRQASILVAGDNFGCGSSREGAVWALWAFGIRAVIAPSFGTIFANNCFQNGLLPVAVAEEAVEGLMAEATGAAFSVDLEACEIRAPSGRIVAFEVEPRRRQALLAGLDEVAATLQREDEIAAFQARDRERRPWLYA